MIISKLATDVARGVYAHDAAFFQKDLDKVIADAIRTAIQGAQAMWPIGSVDLRNKRESFHSAECLNGHVWDDVNSMDDQAFTQASCPFGGGLFSRCGATLTINYVKTRKKL